MSERFLVFGEALRDNAASASLNVARNLAALGLPALMVTRVGNDASGVRVRDEFTRCGLSTQGLQHGPAPSAQAFDQIEAAAALDVTRAFSPNFVYFGTPALRTADARAAFVALLDGAPDAERFLDLTLRDGVPEAVVFEALQHADIVKVNEAELQALFAWYCHTCPDTVDMDCAAVEAEARALMHNFSLQGLIVTLERGLMYFGADGARVVDHAADQPAQLVDAVGVGEAFAAMFLACRARGGELPQVLARARAYADAVAGLAGALAPDAQFYAHWRAMCGAPPAPLAP